MVLTKIINLENEKITAEEMIGKFINLKYQSLLLKALYMTSFDVSSAITLNTYVRQYCQPWCLLKSDNLLKDYIKANAP